MRKLFLILVSCFVLVSSRAQQLQEMQVRQDEERAPASSLSPVARQFQDEWNAYGRVVSLSRQSKGAARAGLKTEARLQLEKMKESYDLRGVSTAGKRAGKNRETYRIAVFVDFTDDAALNEAVRHGLEVSTMLKTLCTGLVSPDSMEALSEVAGVRYIEVSTKAKVKLDSVRVETGAGKVQAGGEHYGQNDRYTLKAYRGEGVVVGIVDIGFDYTHPTFYDPDDISRYRVRRVWDQRAETGARPEGYDYGAEYTTQDAILQAGHCQVAGSHGSHVAGIAGGSGAGTRYGGMAPKSDLVFVSTTMYEQGILDGINYIKDYAARRKQPCVVNLSIGSHTGPHDGTSSFDRACDQLKSDGFVLVGAAGNEGQDSLYLQHTFAANTEDTLMWSVIGFDGGSSPMDIWSDDASDFYVGFELRDRSGKYLDGMKYYYSSASGRSRTETLKSGGNEVRLSFQSEHNALNGKARVYVSMDASGIGDLDLLVQMKSVKTRQTMSVQMWLNSGTFSKGGYTDSRVHAGSASHTVGEIGGTGNSIVSVGASVSRSRWDALDDKRYGYTSQNPKGDIALFSSHGPTADNRMKPDVTAPGGAIISSYNSYDKDLSGDNSMGVHELRRNDREYRFGVMQGTSMASPAAAGVIALWLQADSSLDVDEVKEIIKETSGRSYPGAGTPGMENTWGHGRIDALAGIRYILKAATPADTTIVADRDTVAPSVSGITTRDGVSASLCVHFSEPVERSSAQNTANYRIEGLGVSSAVLDDSRQAVTLTTTGMKAASYNLVVNNVEDTAGNRMENVSAPFSFRYAQVADVAGLCALRQTREEGKIYQVSGDVTVTAVVGKFGTQRNITDVWIQDRGCTAARGHSIMLYNTGGVLPATVREGIVFRGLAGELSVYDSVLQWRNFRTDALEITGQDAPLTVDEVTIARLKEDVFGYQNAMVRLKDVALSPGGGSFGENRVYTLADGDGGILSLYTNREGDYLGEPVPDGKLNVTGYVGYHNGIQFCIRKMADIEMLGPGDPVSAGDPVLAGIKVYPNPNKGVFHIEVPEKAEVSVFSLDGSLLEKRNVQAGLHEMRISQSGSYVLRVHVSGRGVSRRVTVL
ncbi:MAG: S8 family serine peptidase [Bacteroides sp.]|nr:S8 family serine peptidase [Bacteroides sp.]